MCIIWVTQIPACIAGEHNEEDSLWLETVGDAHPVMHFDVYCSTVYMIRQNISKIAPLSLSSSIFRSLLLRDIEMTVSWTNWISCKIHSGLREVHRRVNSRMFFFNVYTFCGIEGEDSYSRN